MLTVPTDTVPKADDNWALVRQLTAGPVAPTDAARAKRHLCDALPHRVSPVHECFVANLRGAQHASCKQNNVNGVTVSESYING